MKNEGFQLKWEVDDIPTSVLIDAFKSIYKNDPIHSRYLSLDSDEVYMAMERGVNLESYRTLYNFGFHFEKNYCCDSSDMVYSFEVIKFLRRKVIPWENGVLADIVKYGTLEMIRNARQHGCPWSSYCGQEYLSLLDRMVYSSEIFNYLVDNGCPFAFDQSYPQMPYIIGRVGNSTDLLLLEFFVGRSSRFDN